MSEDPSRLAVCHLFLKGVGVATQWWRSPVAQQTGNFFWGHTHGNIGFVLMLMKYEIDKLGMKHQLGCFGVLWC